MTTRQNQDQGFTLIELLVVIAIIGLLGGLGITMLMSARRDAEDAEARAYIQSVSAVLEIYKNDRRNGVYPPTSLEGFHNLGSKLPNRTNLGIESLVVCLSSPNFQGDKIFDSSNTVLQNLDTDTSNQPMTIFKSKELFEVLDPWGNPYAYFNAADYDDTKVREYLAFPEGAGDFESVTVVPWKNPKTKSYYNLTTFQMFSAGQDGIFNTEDDIGNWTTK